MDRVDEAVMVANRGIAGNADQGGRRQVTLLEEEVWWRLMGMLGADEDPSGRRANVLLRGIPLAGSRGRFLRLGACLVRINGETKPCERMDELVPGLRELMWAGWQGGAFAEVIEGGTLRVGDAVMWEA